MMPLSMAKEGEPVVIKKVGGKDETRQFLENLTSLLLIRLFQLYKPLLSKQLLR